MSVPHSLDYCKLLIILKLGNVSSPTLVFFFPQNCWSIWYHMCFHVNFRINLSVSAKILGEILIGIIVNLKITLGTITILTGLSRWLSDKESACQTGDMGLIPGSRKPPGKGNSNQLFPGKSQGQRNLVGYDPWGCNRVRHD